MIIYRTENKLNGKFYYGVTNGNNPYYLGSGRKLKDHITKYGKDNFIRRTIKEFDTKEEAYKFETIMVDDLLLANPKCLNLALGGKGGWEHINNDPNHSPWNKGIKDPTSTLKRKQQIKQAGINTRFKKNI